MNYRKLHWVLGWILTLPLFVMTLTGLILAFVDFFPPGTLKVIYEIHRGRWGDGVLEIIGRGLMSGFGVFIALLWPTGILIRRSRNRSLQCNRRALHKHRFFGFWGGALIFCTAGSGALLNFYPELVQLLDPLPANVSCRSTLDTVTLPLMEKKAKALRPQSEFKQVYFPKRPSDPLLFYFSDNSRVYINGITGCVVKVMSPETLWIHGLYPFHSARILGNFSIPYVLGLGILIFLVSYYGLTLRPLKGRFF